MVFDTGSHWFSPGNKFQIKMLQPYAQAILLVTQKLLIPQSPVPHTLDWGVRGDGGLKPAATIYGIIG